MKFFGCIVFLVSCLLFLSGIWPLSYLGIFLPLIFFVLWGIDTSFLFHLWGGIVAAFFITGFSGVPSGVYFLLFPLISTGMVWGKQFLRTHFLLGDVVLASGSMLGGYLAYLILMWVFNVQVSFSLFELFTRILVFGLGIFIFYSIFYFQYSRGSRDNALYVQ